MKLLRFMWILCALGWAQAQAEPPFSGTIFLDPDLITEDDPTAFVSLTGNGMALRTMFDRRVNQFIQVNAHLFDASYDDGLKIEIQVNEEFNAAEALAQAEFYAEVFGRLPTSLRRDVETSWIHRGDEAFGGGNNNLLIHTGSLAEDYIARGILEETLVHEASHTSLDADHAASPGWLAAQAADGEFISTYARDFPNREDVAESFLLIYALDHRRDRISDAMANTIASTIPNRIEYFRGVPLDLYPNGSNAEASRNDQYWIVGLGSFSDSTLTVEQATSTSGGVFGANFDPAVIQRPIWGRISIEFTGCASAVLDYESTTDAVFQKAFGSGGYALERLLPNAGQRGCEAAGFGSTNGNDWVSGTWYGGADRSGEGFLIDVLEDGSAFVAWFTYGDQK